MSNYIYRLFGYRAVKAAEIVIDGITVLAGDNGTGKSTLSRWLYYIVKVLSEYEGLIDKEATTELRAILLRLEKAGIFFDDNSSELRYAYAEMQNSLNSNSNISCQIEKMFEFVEKYVRLVSEKIKELGIDSNTAKRMLTLFDLENNIFSDTQELVEAINTKLLNSIVKIQEEIKNKKESRTTKTFSELLPTTAEDADNIILQVDFLEDGVELLDDKHFSPVLNLNRVIYYKTYEVMDYLNNDSDFKRYLENPAGKMSDQEKFVYKIASQIIGGNLNLHDDGWSFNRKQLYYYRKDGLEIPLRQASTGLISFSYLVRLLENGYLRKGTLLIIDEPEAHLHPKWIVEYARILVMLHKNLDLKVVLSTHNPDMLAAIDAIARKEDISDKVNFYFAKADTSDGEYKFIYERQDSIGGIFDSFNIALSSIQAYGDE